MPYYQHQTSAAPGIVAPRITIDNELDGGSGGAGSSVGRPLPVYPPLPPNAANFMAGVEAERRAINR